MESIELKIYQNKLLVSDLIFNVLAEKMSVQDAINHFPNDKNDINIKCAFNALMHREADEDLRKNVADYKELQDDLLETIANILKRNEKLPKNIIERYNKFYENDIIYKKEKSFFKEILENLKRNISF